MLYYTSADARINRDRQLPAGTPLDDGSGFWTTYEMKSGFGFGGGISLVSETVEMPAYTRTDLVFFLKR